MKILELTNYTEGACGVFARVLQESKMLSKNHEVRIFSSNRIKGAEGLAKTSDVVSGIKINRFPAKKLGGESFMFWNFEEEAARFRPDVIIAHAYRHPHTIKAIRLAKKINSRVFLVTHAPFIENNSTRSPLAKLAVWLFDNSIGRWSLDRFDKVIAITKWEIPILEGLGLKKSRIAYIPNGIPGEFFKQKKEASTNKILFLGRIAPVKSLETLIKAMPFFTDKKIKIELVGPAEKEYLSGLKDLIKNLGLESRIIFSKPIYDLADKIKKIDSAKIFILPSKTEAMPQSLIESMARGKIVISSDNRGSKALVFPGKNGFLFRRGDEKDLADKVNKALLINSAKMQKAAKASVTQFSWDIIIKKLNALIG